MLQCIALALQLCCRYDASSLHAVYPSFHRTVNNYTGGQSVSFVLVWQPTDCIDLFVLIIVFCVILGK